ncbi:hypothetical protein KAURM247S_05713 [Kitasatospora aureofaciens]
MFGAPLVVSPGRRVRSYSRRTRSDAGAARLLALVDPVGFSDLVIPAVPRSSRRAGRPVPDAEFPWEVQ